jgi:hypothetical protein
MRHLSSVVVTPDKVPAKKQHENNQVTDVCSGKCADGFFCCWSAAERCASTRVSPQRLGQVNG